MAAKRTRLRIAREFLLHLTLIGGAVLVILPFLWMITTSLKPVKEAFLPPYFIPASFEWRNYVIAWQAAPFVRFYLNSFLMGVSITVGQVLSSAMAAYAFTRLRFPGRDKLFLLFLATMMIPFHVQLIPAYLVIQWLHWLDTYQALIVPRLVSAFGIFLLRQYFLTIPKELDEAALLDGCSRLAVLWRIILPLAQPALAALGIFAFLFAWNDFLWPLIVTNSAEMRPIQVGLAVFNGKYGTQWVYLMAGTAMATLPGLLIFFAGQRKFVEGMVMSGLKE